MSAEAVKKTKMVPCLYYFVYLNLYLLLYLYLLEAPLLWRKAHSSGLWLSEKQLMQYKTTTHKERNTETVQNKYI